ncbi:serine-rich adhesin for platelets-like isoform X2 [Teleopsis dalmanni]|uniref:serine-rich adhesin for platelets-like isoform X2 n=1 Tax=Teleopsis dalmanni TaxID=139649 RepID=UPI0018CE3315|nr:serine-rich adhesin for platelets-like isoform X2 [Teleopsis dalmanni]
MSPEYHLHSYYVLLMTINVTLTLIVMLAACLCCKKKLPKNDLLGLEGMVKLKNPDEVIVVTTLGVSESQADLNLSTISNADSEKRASTAAHRSLPDIPVAEVNGDNGSELYETVADKRQLNAQDSQDKSPSPSLKKLASVSQHSSISQADDVSSPYSRVKNSPHDYAKVRSTEHPYAQLNVPSTSAVAQAAATNNSQNSTNTESVNRNSHHSGSSLNLNDNTSQVEIPAASAIAGMISASQDLPYMTPPIASQHFSGDSQDSSSYTSISVREPLANILAQQPAKPVKRNAPLTKDVNDSHYATVSDDSDETYAAIEDPNGRIIPNLTADIYTSGSETYAQIQPMQSNSIVVSVEINNLNSSNLSSTSLGTNYSSFQHIEHSPSSVSTQQSINHNRPISDHVTPIPPPVDSLRAQMHSRQASSSSNNSSSMGNLGSPKPEKRQANSPLPPTPKSNSSQQQLHTISNSNLASGRSSIISVIECGILTENAERPTNDNSPQKKSKSLSPSKDIEGMYAKVMKKNKITRNSSSSQNNSPVLTRKYNENINAIGLSPLDAAADELLESSRIAFNSINEKNRTRSNSYTAKDHSYETIPADAMRGAVGIENRKSDCYANILQKERLQESVDPKESMSSVNSNTNSQLINRLDKPPINLDRELAYRNEKHYETIAGPHSGNNDPGYETLNKSNNKNEPGLEKKSSDYDPNYEVLKDPKYSNKSVNCAGLSDDGYAKVSEKKLKIDDDTIDGYSKVRGEDCDDGTIPGYSTIGEPKNNDTNHNYASILETKAEATINTPDTESDHYAHIAEAHTSNSTSLPLSSSSTTCKSTEQDDSTTLTTRLSENTLTSPTSINSSFILHNSSSTNVTRSTSTLSTRQTPTSLSQYESLTGSDTDPNYESVSYLNTNRENPYERLQTDYSDTQLSSPVTPEDNKKPSPTGGDSANGTIKTKSNTSTSDLNAEVLVDDYFQV